MTSSSFFHPFPNHYERIWLDEGASISIVSSFAWQTLGSPQHVPVTQNLLDFNKTISEPLGILPQLPITLEGTNICINLMVVEGPLDFNFLLRRDYVYAMKVVISTLFHVMYCPHNGNIVTIDQISFIDLDLAVNHMTSLNVPYMQVVSSLPWVNYVETTPVF